MTDRARCKQQARRRSAATGRRAFALSVAALGALRLGTASAQSMEHPSGPEPEVEVRAPASDRTDERAFAAPEAVSITRASDLRKVAPMSIADALRTTPSVSVQQTTPGQGTVYVRGLSGRAVVYAVDGVRLNTAFFRAGNNDYLGLVDPYSLTDVTVIPGATSVEYGSDALGGAVLMGTTTPQYRLGPAVTTFRVLQNLSSNPVGTASRLSILHEAKDWGIHGGFTYYQAGAIRPGEGLQSPDPRSYAGLERTPDGVYTPRVTDTQLGTEFESYSGDIAVRRRLGAGTHLVGRAQVSARPDLIRYDQVTPRFKRTEPQRAEAGLAPMSRQMVSMALDHHFSDSWFDSARAVLAWQRISEHRYQRSYEEQCVEGDVVTPAPEEGCPASVRLTPAMSRATEANASNMISARAEARASGRTASLILGADARYDRIDSSAETEDLRQHTREPRDSRYPSGSSLSEGGLFAHTRVRVAERLHVFAGGRLGAFLLDVPGRGGPDSAPFSKTLVDIAGSLGANWEFAPHVAWTANAARGVRSPNVEDVAALGTRAGGRYQIPNPDLGPEHSYTVDTGFKVLRKGARLQSFVFYTRYDDAIILSPTTVNGAAATSDGDLYYHSTNASSVDLYGLDANFDLELARPVATFARALAMQGTQKNQPGSGLPEVTPADRVPPVQGELGLRFTPANALRLELWVQARAAQRRLNDPVNLDDNRIPENGTPAWTTYHARVTYLNDAMTARLTVDNFTNRLVLEHGSGFYRPGFAVTGSVELRFDTAPKQ